ncbi:MAG: endonuclease/exonuclease/phosphatase family protein [Pseudomonadota bacterium]
MRSVLSLTLCLLLAACSTSDQAARPVAVETTDSSALQVSVMAFNVENLFDTLDDPGKNDATYLPAATKSDPAHIDACNLIEVDRWRDDCLHLDWSEAALQFKLEQLARTILAFNNGRGPDIIALQEVENIRVLERLRQEYLRPAGYLEPILIEGIDDRGIDVAFLSRLRPVGEAVLHPLDMSSYPDGAQDTRGVLQADFELPDGSVLTGFSVHFPAPFHPIEMRWIAYEHLNRVRAGLPSDRPVFAAGDFNTPAREQAGTTIMDEMVRPYWTVAHEVGCAGCQGTNYWARGESWSFLDMLLFAPSAESQWVLDVDSVEVVTAYPGQINPDGTPNRFDLEQREGVSDHLPIVMRLVQDTEAKVLR